MFDYNYLMYNVCHTLKELVQLRKEAVRSHQVHSTKPVTSYLNSSLQILKHVQMQREYAQIQ